ncbi:hypothetical protein CEXT_617011, partial [Caerostris extrusa]
MENHSRRRLLHYANRTCILRSMIALIIDLGKPQFLWLDQWASLTQYSRVTNGRAGSCNEEKNDPAFQYETIT